MIKPRYLMLAIRSDEELNALFGKYQTCSTIHYSNVQNLGNVVIPESGVLVSPIIYNYLSILFFRILYNWFMFLSPLFIQSCGWHRQDSLFRKKDMLRLPVIWILLQTTTRETNDYRSPNDIMTISYFYCFILYLLRP